jgi:3-hydroxyacyl-[acyl-carrier-protein] dehydratase
MTLPIQVDRSPMSAVSPVAGQLNLVSDNEVTIRIDPDEPVFAGHYPGFAIFPGMCVVEVVHRGALLTAPAEAGELTMAAMESVRFVAPVFPDDELTVAIEWRQDGEHWHCSAKARVADRHVATVKLRYRSG